MRSGIVYISYTIRASIGIGQWQKNRCRVKWRETWWLALVLRTQAKINLYTHQVRQLKHKNVTVLGQTYRAVERYGPLHYVFTVQIFCTQCRPQGKSSPCRDSAHCYYLSVCRKLALRILSEPIESICNIVMGGRERISRRKAVGQANNDGACSLCELDAKERVVLRYTSDKPSTMNVDVKRTLLACRPTSAGMVVDQRPQAFTWAA